MAAAVLGVILGALATAAAIFAFVGISAVVGQDDGGTGLAGALSGIFLVFALIALTVAVLLIWGSVLAITGRSRVLLIVGAALLTALGLISFFGSIGNDATDTRGDHRLARGFGSGAPHPGLPQPRTRRAVLRSAPRSARPLTGQSRQPTPSAAERQSVAGGAALVVVLGLDPAHQPA
jgi:hypothetical protein